MAVLPGQAVVAVELQQNKRKLIFFMLIKLFMLFSMQHHFVES